MTGLEHVSSFLLFLFNKNRIIHFHHAVSNQVERKKDPEIYLKKMKGKKKKT